MKRGGLESFGSLAAILNAAEDTSISPSIILERNAIVDKRKTKDELVTLDVKGDGNCFFRALAVCLTGTENDHSRLQANIIQYMAADNNESVVNAGNTADANHVREHIIGIGRDSVWVRDEVAPAATSYIGRNIYIYFAIGKSWPRIYLSLDGETVSSTLPVKLAFYEPGYYKAMLHSQAVQHLN